MFDTIYRKELFGKPNCKEVLLYNKVFVLLELCIVMYNEREVHFADTGEILPNSYFIEKYNLECIEHTMLCNKLNIGPLLSVYGIEMKETNRTTGINYMAVNENDGAAPDFEIV